jgi:predicted metalloprotease with PDZ domain
MHRFHVAGALAIAITATTWSDPIHAADLATPYPGTITLDIDLTMAARKIFVVHETIPVKPGPLTLYYPAWIPGDHAPDGPIINVAAMVFRANGKVLPWHRDLVDMFAIHVDIPAGATTLDADFDYLSAHANYILTGGNGVSATSNLFDLEWNQVVLYPAGHASRAITIRPSAKMPEGWQFATALQPHNGTGTRSAIHFDPVTLNNLVDSPIVAGRYFKQVDLAPGARAPVDLDMVADEPKDLAITPQQIDDFRNLVKQENRMFGAHHYQSYHALLTLSDYATAGGLEHHQSSDDRVAANYLVTPQAYLSGATLIPHEYTHSWNGKFRRPQDLWTPDFNSVPMKDDLLWVYEGLTEYWADVMAVRSGFWTPAQFRQSIAMTAAAMDHVPGRTWESLQNVVNTTQLLYYVPTDWDNWRRGTDFYPEGVLLWLEVDTRIRELSHDRRSLDDFARLFYGMDDGSYVTRTYTFGDVVNALDQVQPYDWAGFLRAVLDATPYHANLAGLSQGGWKLVYTDKPSDMWKASYDKDVKSDIDAMSSMGFSVSDKGKVIDVLWNGPAFDAGLDPGMIITAVNGKAFSPDVLKEAIAGTRGSARPVKLLVRDVEKQYRTLQVDYHGGLKYPHLERVKGTPDYLDRIAKPLKG